MQCTLGATFLEYITHVAHRMHRDSTITAAWLRPHTRKREVRTIPHQVTPFRRLARWLLALGSLGGSARIVIFLPARRLIEPTSRRFRASVPLGAGDALPVVPLSRHGALRPRDRERCLTMSLRGI